jgi:hypothetical protein
MAMYPTHECQTYVDHLLAEHRRLHTLLRLARSAVLQSGGPDRDATTDDILRLLQRIRDELMRHFAEEEAGGCLEEAVSRCPRLSAQAGRIQAEHPELLAELDAVIAHAADCDQTVQSRLAFERHFDSLCERLHAHEAAENDLLRQGFGANVNGGQSDQTSLALDR